VADVVQCLSLDFKFPGDLIYILGETQDELGGSEYYEMMGAVGLQVPRFQGAKEKGHYQALQEAIRRGLVSAAHGIYRGGLATHLTLMALAGDLGLEVDLSQVPVSPDLRPDKVLFSETCGRVILTVDPKKQASFEGLMKGCVCREVGRVTREQRILIRDQGRSLIKARLKIFRAAFHRPFGDLV